MLPSEDLNKSETLFLADSGSQLNLIKIENIKNLNEIDKSIIYELQGISDIDKPMTLGRIKIEVNNKKEIFSIIPNNFPIEFDAILGHEILGENKGRIDWTTRYVRLNDVDFPFTNTESFLLRARQKAIIYVRVNNALDTGYVPRIPLGDDIFVGEALVTNTNGKAYLYAINTSDKDVRINVPVISLYPFDMSIDEADQTDDSPAKEQ